MKFYDSLEDAIKDHPNSYVSFDKWGNCMVCKKYHDLCCGVCFTCSPLVDGSPIKGGHRLWERANPENAWYVGN